MAKRDGFEIVRFSDDEVVKFIACTKDGRQRERVEMGLLINLNAEEFTSLLEAKVLVEEYRKHYNERRPHSSLGYRTPAEFAVSCELADVDTAFTKDLQSVTTLS